MYNLIDIVQLKTKKDRSDIEEILTAAVDGTIEYLKEGSDVYWVGLGRFTWKKKATTKKAAKEWTEYPYLAEGDKVRFVPIPELSEINAKGSVLRMKREKEDGEVPVATEKKS